MKVRTLLAAVVAATLLLLPSAGAEEEAAEEAPAYAAPVVVGEDDAGDWGSGAEEAPVGAALGQDLVGATIGMPTADTFEFVIGVTELPANGGAPEVTRYIWSLTVDGNPVELDGKWSNYSRGVCDPTSGKCPPPRDPGTQPFFIRGNCVTEGSVTSCQEIGLVQATFDADAGTITVPVPAELINAGPCSVIDGGANLFGDNLSASPSAFLSLSTSPADTLWMEHSFQVPSGDPELPCEA